MIQSMTGFGVAEDSIFKVEIRSVNHRFIDISIKIPPYMAQYDIPLRNIIKERFQRGKFDVSISLKNSNVTNLKINTALAKDIYNALTNLKKEFNIPGEITINTLAGYIELFIEKESIYDDSLYNVFLNAVSDLEAMRIREGEYIVKDLYKRIELLNAMNEEIKLLVPKSIEKIQEKMNQRIKLLLRDEDIDTSRIIQEVAIISDKMDISEELYRIENHIKQFTEILNNGDIIGRKLDFLLQEINREVNTLSYKSNDYGISRIVVDMKTEIEKIREQVQNIQ